MEWEWSGRDWEKVEFICCFWRNHFWSLTLDYSLLLLFFILSNVNWCVIIVVFLNACLLAFMFISIRELSRNSEKIQKPSIINTINNKITSKINIIIVDDLRTESTDFKTFEKILSKQTLKMPNRINSKTKLW